MKIDQGKIKINLIIGLVLQLLKQLDKLLTVVLHHAVTIIICSSNQPEDINDQCPCQSNDSTC